MTRPATRSTKVPAKPETPSKDAAKTKAEERAARAKRAREAGNQRAATATPRPPRPRKEIVEPEKSNEAAAKQAAQALARLKVAEAERKAQDVTDAQDALRDKALARRDGKGRSPVSSGGIVHAPVPGVRDIDLNAAIQNLEPEFIQCRDWGHSWRPFHAQWIENMHHFEQILKCARCSTERTRYLGARGQILDNKYGYQEGYQMPKGTGRMTTTDRDMVRLVSMRILEKTAVAG